MKRFYIILFIVFLFVQIRSNAQGCVAIRSNGNSCSLGKPGDAKGWNFNLNTRYFRSYKHFVGKEEQKERVERRTEVINYSFSWDLTFTRTLNNRWSLAFNLPFISNVRSSMYEHYGNGNSTKPGARRKTESLGYSGRLSISSRIIGWRVRKAFSAPLDLMLARVSSKCSKSTNSSVAERSGLKTHVSFSSSLQFHNSSTMKRKCRFFMGQK